MYRSAKGFTLIELLIVIAILGSLAAITIVSFSGQSKKARDVERRSDIKQYQNALETYANRSGGLYPVQGIAVDATTLCGASQPLGDIPCQDDVDPLKNYMYVSDGSGLEYVLWSQMERTGDYFVICSNGDNGDIEEGAWTAPTGGSCPL